MSGPRLDRHATEFERLRPYLLRVAYAHTGSVSEADDVVQEAWLRLQRSSDAEIRDLRAWLTTTISRLAVDALTSARARRETYVGSWLPEPIVHSLDAEPDPAERLTLDESVSMALLIVLEALTAAERCAFLLHDVFGYPFDEVAAIVGRTPQATRQLAARARRAVEAGRPRQPADPDQQRQVVEAFLDAAAGGDIAGLLAVLDPDVRFRSDGGGAVVAARQDLIGAERVARALTAMARHYAGSFEAEIVDVNGAPGLLVTEQGAPTVVAFTLDAGRIREINVIRNPHKLRHIGPGTR
jgi:RNA polymerase sigma-70 factor, ECF subfamily